MAGLSDLRIRITADGSQATRAMQQVGTGMGRLRSEATASDRAMSALRGTFMGLAAAVAGGFGISRLGQSFMEANRSAGMLRASLETVTGSVQKAADAWDVLQGFAASTPFDMQQVVESFILLKARGLDPSMAALTSFGNTASAMAKPLKQMIEAVADASTGSFVRLEEFGIKASKSGDKVSLTFKNVTKTIGTSAQEIQDYLLSIGNVDFAGAMEKQTKTLEGAISNLGDTWAQMWVQIGDTGLTAGVSAVIRDLGDGLAEMGNYLTMADGVGDAFTQTLAEMGKAVAATYAELKSGVWSDTTVVIMATAGAVAGATGLMLGLKAAIGLATIAWGLFTAVLIANPVTLAIVAVGALAGAMYTLRDETIQVGTTTTTVGALVESVWETTASYSQAAWETFADFVAGEFNRLPPIVTAAGQAVVSVWSVTMSNLMAISDKAINYVMNLFRWVGRSAGVLAGEIAMTFESGFNWDRLKAGLAGAVEYTDMLGEASTEATAAIAAAGKAIEDKAGAIADSNLEEQLGAVVTAEHAKQQRESALAAKMAALSAGQNTGAMKGMAEAAKGAGGAAKGAAKGVDEQTRAMDALIKKYLPARSNAEELAEGTIVLNRALAAGKISAEEYATALAGLTKDLDTTLAVLDKYDRAGAAAREFAEDAKALNQIIADGGPAAERASKALVELQRQQQENTKEASAFSKAWERAVERVDDMFADMWKSLITGSGNAFEKVKDMLLNWLAEMAHALLTRPLTVAISTAMLPGGASAQGLGGMLGGGGGGIGGMMQGLGTLGKGIQSIFSGAAFTGITGGFTTAMNVIGAGGYFGSMGTLFTAAGSAFGSGAGAAAIGMIAPYALPVIAAVAAIATIMKKSETKPRAAWDVGPMRAWEDNVYSTSKGLGVNFGFGGKSHKVDANEYKGAFDAMAEMADALAEFYGKEVAAQVRDMINNNVHVDGGKGLRWNNSTFDFDTAFDVIFTQVLNMGAKTGDVMAKALRDEAGDLEADAEKAAEQIGNAMNAVLAYKEVSESWDTPIGELLGVTGELGADIQLLRGYVTEFGNASEASGETIARLLATAQQVELAARLTATSLEGMSGKQVLEFGEQLAQAFGGLEKLTTAQAFYYDQFFSAQEKVNRLMGEAIDSINSKLPKLRDEILALGQDITATVKTLATEAVAATTEAVQGAADLSRDALNAALKGDFSGDAGSGAGGAETVALYKLMQKDKEATDAWMRSMKEGRQVWEDYVASLTSGVDKITDAAQTPTQTQARIETITTTITPGDPNAAIYAALIAGIPPTRDAFNDLMGAIDLTSEAGKKLYAGLLELAPAFDLLYDAVDAFQGWIDPASNAAASMERLEGVFADLGLIMPETGAALMNLYESGVLTTEQMAMLGASLEDLKAVYDPMIAQEKALAAARQDLALLTLELEQGPEAALAERRRLELAALDESLRPMQEHIWALEDEAAAATKAAEALARAKDTMQDLESRIADLQDPAGAQGRARLLEMERAIAGQTPETAARLRELYESLWDLEDAAAAVAAAMAAIKEREGLMIRLAEASGNSAEATRLRREIELRDALDETNRAILRHIYAIEDARAAMTKAIDDEYNAKIAAIDAAQKAQQAAHQAAMEALNKQRDAAQEALNVAQGLLSTIQSALDGMRGQQEYDEMSHARAAKQLAAWAKDNTLPDVDKLSKVLDILAKADKQDYATEADYRYAQATTFANLLALEAKAEKEVNWAEKQLKAIEDQVAALNKMNDSIMDGFQAQRVQADAWRDAQLAAMEAQLKAMAALASVLGGARPGPIPGTPPIPGAPPIPGTPIPPPTPLPPPADNYQKLNEAQIAEIKALREEMGLLRKDMAAIGTAQVVPLSSLDERLRKWDSDGLPPGRDNVILLRAG